MESEQREQINLPVVIMTGGKGNRLKPITFAIKNRDSISQDNVKERFGLSDRYVITCGYIQQKAQRHTVIIEAIDQDRNRLPENLTFVHVQTTDAGSRSVYEYILYIKKIFHRSWIKYVGLEAFKPLFYFPIYTLDNMGDVIVKAYNSDKIKIPQGILDKVLNRS